MALTKRKLYEVTWRTVAGPETRKARVVSKDVKDALDDAIRLESINKDTIHYLVIDEIDVIWA